MNTLITFSQLFGIGFSFGIFGPCLITCTAITLPYILKPQAPLKKTLTNIFVLLMGRLSAYLCLGYLAGISGIFLKQFINTRFTILLKIAAGLIIIYLGILIFINKKKPECKIGKFESKLKSGLTTTTAFILGFTVGFSPCAPLITLLLQISLMSKSPLEGMMYALFFGLGTFLSGLIIIGALASLFGQISKKILNSKKINFIFRLICALLIISIGLSLILRNF
ncbi:sulfite exporter TauE/SafE family protein [bacterium]